MACLRWTIQAGPPHVFSITKRVTSIGKSPMSDLVLDEQGLIDAHAQIVFEGREFLVSELDAGGSIEINGKKKRRARLQHGDRIKLGEVELQFSLLAEASAAPSEAESAQEQHELSGMRRLAEFNRKLAELENVTQALDAFLEAILDVTRAQKGML